MATDTLAALDAACRLAKLDPAAVRVLLAALDEASRVEPGQEHAYAQALGRVDGAVRCALSVALRVHAPEQGA